MSLTYFLKENGYQATGTIPENRIPHYILLLSKKGNQRHSIIKKNRGISLVRG